MILDWEQLQIFIKPGITDMRKQINSLAVLTQEELKLDPLSGNLFVFCNRSRKIMKILYWGWSRTVTRCSPMQPGSQWILYVVETP